MKTRLKTMAVVVSLLTVLSVATSAQYSPPEITSLAGFPQQTVAQLPDDTVRAMEWNADGSLLAISRQNGSVEIIDGATLNLLHTLQADTAGPTAALAWHPDIMTPYIASGGYDGVIRVWDVTNGNLVYDLTGFSSGDLVVDISWNSDGTQITGFSVGGGVITWDTTTRSVVYSEVFPNISGMNAGQWNIDDTAFAISRGAYISILDGSNQNRGSQLNELMDHTAIVVDLDWSPSLSSPRLLVSAGLDNTVRLWNTVSGENLYTLVDHDAFVIEVKFNPDGSKIASLDEVGTLIIWETATGNLLQNYSNQAILTFDWQTNDTLLFVDRDSNFDYLQVNETSSHPEMCNR